VGVSYAGVGRNVGKVCTIGGQVKCSVRSMFSCCFEVAILLCLWLRCAQMVGVVLRRDCLHAGQACCCFAKLPSFG
jgi:hypothetical protein